VRKLAKALSRHGLRVWYSDKHIPGAQQWHDEIGRALARCDWFLLVLSPRSVRSRWVKYELLYALREERYTDRILPVLHRPCNCASLSWTLPGFQMVDFTGDFDAACGRLLRRWGVVRRRG